MRALASCYSPCWIWPDVIYSLSLWLLLASLLSTLMKKKCGAHVGHYFYVGEITQILVYLGASEPSMERMSLI